MELLPFQHIFLAVLCLPIILAASKTEPLRARSSPSSYLNIVSTTRDGTPSACQKMEPTPMPELRIRQEVRRQQPDSLGWNDPSTCNIGVCASSKYCTVFGNNLSTADTVVGICCVPGPACRMRTSCVDLASHSISTIGTQLAIYNDGTVFCGTSYPYCSSRFVEYGYGLGTFVDVDCYNQNIGKMTTTTRNPSWRLYATETDPKKGPSPTTIYESSSSFVSSTLVSSSLSSTGTRTRGVSTGAIAGIAVGGIAAIALCVGAIFAVRSFLKKPQPPKQPPQQLLQQQGGLAYRGYQTKEIEQGSPALMYASEVLHGTGYNAPQWQGYNAQQGQGNNVPPRVHRID
ncbi:hypothetical protein BDD12DRAFT_857464 [Trichophaea hybrida]|nr:hypothetical protein BDD12DRAFT_857464 [Trichophaea hybrida]